MRVSTPWSVLTVAALVGGSAVVASSASAATPSPIPLSGTLHTVAAGVAPDWTGWSVEAYVSGNPVPVADAAADADGTFDLPIVADVPAGQVLSVIAHAPEDGAHPGQPTGTLVSVLPEATAGDITLNERTTVAAAWAMAQFVSADGIAGAAPGLVNSAGMAANLADPRTGDEGDVLATSPNGAETSTQAIVNSLTAALASCVTAPFAHHALYPDGTCAEIIGVGAAATNGGTEPVDVFRALSAIAKVPATEPHRLFALSELVPLLPGAATLDSAPVAWTIALRFNGDGESLGGPGNFAVDHEGNIWVNNNYEYNADPHTPVCGSDLLFKFSPTGEFQKFSGGGLSGAGFGIDIDPVTGNVWVANFGFAAPVPECPAEDQPPHDSASLFTPQGVALSPERGFQQGSLNWPQGMVIDQHNTVWFANCNNATLTAYPKADPNQARVIDLAGTGINQPFQPIDNGQALVVAGIVSDSVEFLNFDGTVQSNSPGARAEFDRPMGLASDAAGNVWVANSAVIQLPCPEIPDPPQYAEFEAVLGSQFNDAGVWTGVGIDPYLGSVALISPDGSDVTRFHGGGLTVPWGIATDGVGNVWVANFAGKRLSSFCGTDASTCPDGVGTGEAISPALTGYYFDGLARSTGVTVDQSGNVWVTNNWIEIPYQTNPGGHEIVAYLGMAAPVTIEAPVGPTPAPTVSPTPTGTTGPALAATGADTAAAAGGVLIAALAMLVGVVVVAVNAARRRRRSMR